MVELIEVNLLKCSEERDLAKLLPHIAKILSRGTVEETVIIDSSYNVRDSIETYLSLEVIGVRYVPVSYNIIEPIKYRLEELGFYDEVYGSPLRVYNNTLELLFKGWPTPLVKISSLSSGKVVVWAKLESYNPFSNSIKDRTAWMMVLEALGKNKLRGLLYEATSTNTGMALAAIANIIGRKVRLYLPRTVQKVSDIYLRALGAEVVRSQTSLTVEAIDEVEERAKHDSATHLNQFENDANFKVHLRFTAKELDLQLKSLRLKPTCIISGLGTSGHLSAISFYFKNRYGDGVRIVGVQPARGETIPGIRRVETGMKWFNWVKIDEIIDVKLEEAAKEVLNIARREGILVGLSSGAIVHAFKNLNLEGGHCILIFPDSGYKYFEHIQKLL